MVLAEPRAARAKHSMVGSERKSLCDGECSGRGKGGRDELAEAHGGVGEGDVIWWWIQWQR